jgi:hypothetical protein
MEEPILTPPLGILASTDQILQSTTTTQTAVEGAAIILRTNSCESTLFSSRHRIRASGMGELRHNKILGAQTISSLSKFSFYSHTSLNIHYNIIISDISLNLYSSWWMNNNNTNSAWRPNNTWGS